MDEFFENQGCEQFCKKCGGTKLSSESDICRSCNKEHMGGCFFSCISELGYIDIEEDILGGCLHGKTNNSFLDLPNGTPIYCRVDKDNEKLFHAICDTNNMTESDWCYDFNAWWKHPCVTKIDFRISHKINEISRIVSS